MGEEDEVEITGLMLSALNVRCRPSMGGGDVGWRFGSSDCTCWIPLVSAAQCFLNSSSGKSPPLMY